MSIIRLSGGQLLSDKRRAELEFEFDNRLRKLLFDMQQAFQESAGACLQASLKRITGQDFERKPDAPSDK